MYRMIKSNTCHVTSATNEKGYIFKFGEKNDKNYKIKYQNDEKKNYKLRVITKIDKYQS